MNRATFLSAALLFLACSGTSPKQVSDYEPLRSVEVTRLTVIGTNDLHGAIHVLPVFAGYVKALRSQEDRAVVVVDGGDMFQGTLESNLQEGAPIVEAYNAIGYSAVTLGNHEFDFGPVGEDASVQREGQDPRGAIRARAKSANFPFLSANILKEDGSRPSWENVPAQVLVEEKGVAVGVRGLSTIETPRVTLPANFVGLKMQALDAGLQEATQELRTNGAELVVVAAHAGGKCSDFSDFRDTSSCRDDEEIFQFAQLLPPGQVDVIVAGHTHQGVAHLVNGVAIIESFARGKAFGRVDFVRGEDGSWKLESIHPPFSICAEDSPKGECNPREYEGVKITPDAGLVKIVARAKERADEVRNEELGVEIVEKITRSHGAPSPLGNLFVDLMLSAQDGKADIAVTNGGSLRADLPAGNLLYGSLFEAMPFDNRLVRLHMTGKSLKAAFAKNLSRENGILSVAGARAMASCVAGEITIKLFLDNGKPVRDDDEIIVATSDFLADGGDNLFTEAASPTKTAIDGGPLLRDAMADALRKRGGRISSAELFTPTTPRISFPGPRPVQCAQR